MSAVFDYLPNYLLALLRNHLRSNSQNITRACLIVGLLLAPIGAQAHTILVLGDSLSAAYGIPRESGWVALLQKKLAHEQNLTRSDVVNASISGDTSKGGLARLPPLLAKHHPDIVVIELGANDGLRGFQIRELRSNLEQLIKLSQQSGAKVLLIGMKMPPNYGLRYTTDFSQSYSLLAQQYGVSLVPFFLDGVATHPELIQADGLHPRAEAQQRLLDNVWPYLQKLL